MAISSQAAQECVEGSTTRAWSPDRTVKPHERAAVRRCSGCKVVQSLDCFAKSAFLCRPCAREYLKKYRAKNRETLLVGKKQWYYANRERVLADKREYTRAVSSKVIARRRQQRQSDPLRLAKHNHDQALRRAAKTMATPKWADLSKIRAFYEEAQRLTIETGIKHSVDHIYPLRGKLCCGLHVHQNLRVIPLALNCSKQNTHPADEIV
jgi:hypothetical protein